MCSKCFKEVSAKNNTEGTNAVATSGAVSSSSQKQIEPELPLTHLTPTAASPPSSTSTLPMAPVQAQPSPVPVPQQQPTPMDFTPTPASHAPDSPAPGERPVQANKGRCFMCRAKIPLAKQAINKCRCEYVFCDTHKAIDKHDCDYEYAKMGRDILAKANPKLNDKPRGGRSFTRLE
ncbi:zinc finger domain-containing protein [Mortierella claussenii]|nr:zinc finger domain-containing protein [Mortierella claussenii]